MNTIQSQFHQFIDNIGHNIVVRQMILSWIWRLFLLAYLGVGIGSLALVFFLEAQFFIDLTNRASIAFLLAGIWELTKLGSSLIRYILGIAGKITSIYIPLSIRFISWGVLACLVLLSIFCCAVTLSSWCYTGEGTLPSDRQHLPLVQAAVYLIQEGLQLKIHADRLISIAAFIISIVLQLTGFMVFVHMLALYTGDIEHRVEVKMHTLQMRQAFDEEVLLLQRNKLRMKAATKASLQQMDELTNALLHDLASRKQ